MTKLSKFFRAVGRLLGGNKPSKTEEFSQSPESFRPRASRIPLSALHHLHLDGSRGKLPASLPVSNISATGIAFVKPQTPCSWPAVGEEFEATLITSTQAPQIIRLKVARDTANMLACSVIDPDGRYRQLVTSYFEAEHDALQVTEVKSALLQNPGNENTDSSEGQPRLFISNEDFELFLTEETSGELSYWYFSFFGNYAEWTGKRLRLGIIDADDSSYSDKPRFGGSTLIQPLQGKELDPATRQAAIRFIRSIPGLSETQKESICSKL